MIRVKDVDVLVVGGGLAGLSAALSAKEQSINVALVCKSRTGKSGNTLVSGGALSVAAEEGGYGDNPLLFEKDLLDSGSGINNKELVRVFAEKSSTVLSFLRKYGVNFKNIEGRPVVKLPPGHSVRRSFPSEYASFSYLNRGLALTVPLLEQAVSKKIQVFDKKTVIKLLTDEKGICGAIVLDNETGEQILFRTGVVILAAGGGAGLIQKNNNTADVSCDSYSLAYEAGAVLRDMEMVQFYPSMMYEPIRMPLSNPLFGDGAVLKNIHGEEFMLRYSEKGNLATRDVMARAVKKEIDEGRGNPHYVFMDCSKIDPEVLDKKYQELSIILRSVGLDIKEDSLPLAPAAHFYIGGADIDSECRTCVDGLLVCGEAAGGLHGANRLSGVALAETVVFGKIAGRTASSTCKRRPKSGKLYGAEDIVVKKRHGNVIIEDLVKKLRADMWENASMSRSANSLKIAEHELEKIVETREITRIGSTRDILRYYQLESMITVARMLIETSLKRMESRGAFFRTDYPEIDDKFRGNYFLKKNTDKKMECYFHTAG